MLSTMLYRACTSMDIIMGRDMDTSSLSTGITPILFSVCTVFFRRTLGEKEFEKANTIAVNGIFIEMVSYVAFALVGIFAT